jgi:hypothetical protein
MISASATRTTAQAASLEVRRRVRGAREEEAFMPNVIIPADGYAVGGKLIADK